MLHGQKALQQFAPSFLARRGWAAGLKFGLRRRLDYASRRAAVPSGGSFSYGVDSK